MNKMYFRNGGVVFIFHVGIIDVTDKYDNDEIGRTNVLGLRTLYFSRHSDTIYATKSAKFITPCTIYVQTREIRNFTKIRYLYAASVTDFPFTSEQIRVSPDVLPVFLS